MNAPKRKYSTIEDLRKEHLQSVAYIANLKGHNQAITRVLAVAVQEIGQLRVANQGISVLLNEWQERLKE